jgi:hypothetical protein
LKKSNLNNILFVVIRYVKNETSLKNIHEKTFISMKFEFRLSRGLDSNLPANFPSRFSVDAPTLIDAISELYNTQLNKVSKRLGCQLECTLWQSKERDNFNEIYFNHDDRCMQCDWVNLTSGCVDEWMPRQYNKEFKEKNFVKLEWNQLELREFSIALLLTMCCFNEYFSATYNDVVNDDCRVLDYKECNEILEKHFEITF